MLRRTHIDYYAAGYLLIGRHYFHAFSRLSSDIANSCISSSLGLADAAAWFTLPLVRLRHAFPRRRATTRLSGAHAIPFILLPIAASTFAAAPAIRFPGAGLIRHITPSAIRQALFILNISWAAADYHYCRLRHIGLPLSVLPAVFWGRVFGCHAAAGAKYTGRQARQNWQRFCHSTHEAS